MSTPLLQLSDVSCAYQQHLAVQQVSLTLQAGDIACLLGPSGCGKTTLLRAIAGFQALAQGQIQLQGKPVGRPGYQCPPERRGIGMVFQDYALFPHLTVAANIQFGLKTANDQAEHVSRLIQQLGLSELLARYPHELSGGQQQRVALARALAPMPALLLLDEPFSNLDAGLRQQLSLDLRQLLKQHNISALLVTHDRQEAFAIADAIGVMHGGQLRQWGSPYALYHTPKDPLVARFMGECSFIQGEVDAQQQVSTALGPLGQLAKAADQQQVTVLVRPDDLVPAAETDDALYLQVADKRFLGSNTRYTLTLGSDEQIHALFPSHHDYAIGQAIAVSVDIEHLITFPREGII